jgi:recombinational DNA repair ATPase RecF
MAPPVKDRISRGQQKLLAAALLMAQLSQFPQDAAVRPTLFWMTQQRSWIAIDFWD